MKIADTHPDLFPLIADYLDALTKSDIAYNQRACVAHAERFGKPVAHYERLFFRNVRRYLIEDHPNSKYIRVVSADEFNTHGANRSAHAFIDRQTGAVYKPQTWKAPAKGKDGKPAERYNLLNPASRTLLFERCEFTGGYLYADRAPGPMPIEEATN